MERGAGVLVHPTSFETDYGIGDLGSSTINFLDFLHKSGQKYWQLLPLGPTSFLDSPYQSFSTFAGNILLISPEILIKQKLLTRKDVYNDLPRDFVAYGDVTYFKNKIFSIAFENFLKLNNKLENDKFNKFVNDNKKWLDDYALFISLKKYYISSRKNTIESKEYKQFLKENNKYLSTEQIKDYFYGAMWLSFDDDIKNRETKAIEKWTKKLKKEIKFEKFLQYKFFEQWNNVKIEAKERDIKIIGDIPIFVSLDSSDVWANKQYFFLDKDSRPLKVAGVPPDYFSKTGQLWGNPLYDFKALKKDGYKWWIQRFDLASELYDIIRIDHFRAFYDYWSIPYGEKTAMKGKWEKGPSYDFFDTIFKNLKHINLIAEDLGSLNDGVLELRDKYHLPGMKILQFAFDSEDNEYLPHNFETSNCIIYTGTHDNDTTKGFYENASDKEKDYIRRYMNVDGYNIVYDLIRLCYSSCANVCIIPMQDILEESSNKRMNTPSTKIGNWQYRYRENRLNDDIINTLKYLTEVFNR